MFKSNVGGIAFGIVNSRFRRLVIRGERCSLPGFHKIPGDFSLAITHDRFAFGQLFNVDVKHLPVIRNIEPFVHMSFFIHAFVHTGFTD